MADQVELLPSQFNKLIAQLEKLNNASGSTRGSSYEQSLIRSTKEEISQREDSADAIEEQTRGIRQQSRYQQLLAKSAGALHKGFSAYGKGLERSYTAHHDLDRSVKKYGKTLKEQSSMISGLLDSSTLANEAQDKFVEKMIASTRSFELLHKQFDSYEKAHGRGEGRIIRNANDLSRAQSRLVKQTDVLDKTMQASGGNLAGILNDLSAIGEKNLTGESLKLYQFAKYSDLLGKDNVQIAAHLKSVKAQIKAMNQNAYHIVDTAKAMEELREKTKAVSGMFAFLSKSPLGLAVTGLGLLATGAMGVWEQFKTLADLGMVGHLREIKASQVKLALSFDAAAKLFAEHTRLLNVIGDKSFTDSISAAQSSLMKLGLSAEQSAVSGAAFAEVVGKAGINVKDQTRLNSAIKAQTDAFAKLRVTTGASIEEFRSMQEELVNNVDVQSILNGVNAQDRDQKLKDMMMLRQRFAQLGMSAQTAQKAMINLQELGKQKVTSRFEQSAKMQQALALAGVGNAAEIANIHRKGARASQAEKGQLAAAMQVFGKWQDTQAQGSYMGELISDVMGEQMDTFKPLIDATREGGLASEAGKAMSDAAVLSAQRLAEISDAFKTGRFIQEGVQAGMKDPAVKMAMGLGALLLSLGGLTAVVRSFFSKSNAELTSINAHTSHLESIDAQLRNQSAATVEDDLGQAGGTVEDDMNKRKRKRGKRVRGVRRGRPRVQAIAATEAIANKGMLEKATAVLGKINVKAIAGTAKSFLFRLSGWGTAAWAVSEAAQLAYQNSLEKEGTPAFNSIDAMIVGVGDSITGFFQGITNTTHSIFEKIKNNQELNTLEKLIYTVNRDIDSVSDWIDSFFTNAGNFFKDVGKAIDDLTGGYISGMFKGIADEIAVVAKDAEGTAADKAIAAKKTAEAKARSAKEVSIEEKKDSLDLLNVQAVQQMSGVGIMAEYLSKSGVSVNPVTAAKQVNAPTEASAPSSATTSTTATKTASKTQESSEDLLSRILTILQDGNDINTTLVDTNRKQLIMLEALVSTNKDAMMEYKVLAGGGNSSLDPFSNFNASRIASMGSGVHHP